VANIVVSVTFQCSSCVCWYRSVSGLAG
jgi:hypothetical protein